MNALLARYPDAVQYITKIKNKGTLGKKKKMAKMLMT